uniref:Uncharacterized protein n=1 Tax=Acrobeloides nanus TaxID=290746 RepID=A0A914CJX4_9BILA
MEANEQPKLIIETPKIFNFINWYSENGRKRILLILRLSLGERSYPITVSILIALNWRFSFHFLLQLLDR